MPPAAIFFAATYGRGCIISPRSRRRLAEISHPQGRAHSPEPVGEEQQKLVDVPTRPPRGDDADGNEGAHHSEAARHLLRALEAYYNEVRLADPFVGRRHVLRKRHGRAFTCGARCGAAGRCCAFLGGRGSEECCSLSLF